MVVKKSCVTACPVEWPDDRGISGRIRVEWVAGSPWNRWSDAHGMGGQMTVESALSRIRTELYYRQVLGRVLRRTGEFDDQAWLFMLAEEALQSFAERIADDLPEDLAVLCTVQAPPPDSDFNTGEHESRRNADEHLLYGDKQVKNRAETGAASVVSLNCFASEPSYQITFSQHYRQQLLACF